MMGPTTGCEGCGNPLAPQQCPKCKDFGIEKPSRFCNQECFKSHFATHKRRHIGAQFIRDTVSADPEHVKLLPSGMAFKVLDEGEGTSGLSPTITGNCSVHYQGTLIDGTPFDSSYERGEPSEFAPNQVIKGWTEALQYMTEGEKWEVYIPMEMAYGVAGSPPEIPGLSTLVFTIELLKVLGAPKLGMEAKKLLNKALGIEEEIVVPVSAAVNSSSSAAAAANAAGGGDEDSDDDVAYNFGDFA
jgi:FKBP-type peptidyl-prolyl cis-trans isomerase FklB